MTFPKRKKIINKLSTWNRERTFLKVFKLLYNIDKKIIVIFTVNAKTKVPQEKFHVVQDSIILSLK